MSSPTRPVPQPPPSPDAPVSAPTPQAPSHAALRRILRRLAGWVLGEDNPAGVVYGTILVGAVIAAEGGLHEGYPELVGSTALVLAVYWLAHAYSTVLGRRLSSREQLTSGALARGLAHDWSIVRGAFVPMLTLLLAWAAGASQGTAGDAAVWATVVSLIVFELLAGVRTGSSAKELVLEGAVGAAMGTAILALKALAR
jgi:hypothetical protein